MHVREKRYVTFYDDYNAIYFLDPFVQYEKVEILTASCLIS